MNIESARSPRADGLSVSIVVYRPDRAQLKRTLMSLGTACERLRAARPDLHATLYLIDNGGLGPEPDAFAALRAKRMACEILSGHGNVGFGPGHNLAIERAASALHLVLNPDIDLDPSALVNACDFFESHSEAGLLTPWIGDTDGEQQYLCRRYPSLADLFIRGFMPASIRRRFARRLARYELRDRINALDVFWDPPIVSGCFMLFRTNVLKRLGGFDPRYFLYFEDYDLSLRTHEVAQIVYVPSVRVVHYGGGAARKGSAHIRMFVTSAFKFFNRFGWRVC
ncbi:glycosyltransferase family 2 protein [Paraburkholderia sp. B3]|uniref:glycosyltransferase family 2 protein n=1 Tax=Paraburkholderia sp. B3 TaxID=3134791 RepID=UPI0039829147